LALVRAGPVLKSTALPRLGELFLSFVSALLSNGQFCIPNRGILPAWKCHSAQLSAIGMQPESVHGQSLGLRWAEVDRPFLGQTLSVPRPLMPLRGLPCLLRPDSVNCIWTHVHLTAALMGEGARLDTNSYVSRTKAVVLQLFTPLRGICRRHGLIGGIYYSYGLLALFPRLGRLLLVDRWVVSPVNEWGRMYVVAFHSWRRLMFVLPPRTSPHTQFSGHLQLRL
jgi:hypothetical protein